MTQRPADHDPYRLPGLLFNIAIAFLVALLVVAASLGIMAPEVLVQRAAWLPMAIAAMVAVAVVGKADSVTVRQVKRVGREGDALVASMRARDVGADRGKLLH